MPARRVAQRARLTDREVPVHRMAVMKAWVLGLVKHTMQSSVDTTGCTTSPLGRRVFRVSPRLEDDLHLSGPSGYAESSPRSQRIAQTHQGGAPQPARLRSASSFRTAMRIPQPAARTRAKLASSVLSQTRWTTESRAARRPGQGSGQGPGRKSGSLTTWPPGPPELSNARRAWSSKAM
eukprot:CAMPEP_0170642562 /NCGR_PEP_ID=MMETSP0224-20130122/41395_1 /TAXON_ID=285029 /ORGANISM="Togula jolla, Strain CCCM 725" /LENGTH=178 /DNA_ID=CAMNT_0010973285 /DNA_START=223 /DNA_END=758 /DNA_ORIENTATION=-